MQLNYSQDFVNRSVGVTRNRFAYILYELGDCRNLEVCSRSECTQSTVLYLWIFLRGLSMRRPCSDWTIRVLRGDARGEFLIGYVWIASPVSHHKLSWHKNSSNSVKTWLFRSHPILQIFNSSILQCFNSSILQFFRSSFLQIFESPSLHQSRSTHHFYHCSIYFIRITLHQSSTRIKFVAVQLSLKVLTLLVHSLYS